MSLSFGVTVLPDPPYTRMIELIQLAEQQGFEYAWTYDSHVLWQESFPVMALVADRTSKIKLGHMVTNPGTREPTVLASAYATLHDISDGRMIMGIGRGDSARRYIGQQPVKVAEFEEALKMIKPFMNGKRSHLERQGAPAQMGAARAAGDRDARRRLRAEGARRRRAPGRRDHHPARRPRHHPVDHGHGPAAAEEAGRDPAALKCIVSAPSHVTDDLQDAREQVRWFPAMVSNHVQDLIDRYGTDGSAVPQALTDYVQARKFYDYNEHSRVGAKHGEFVTDEICDRFCVIGDNEQITAKLRSSRRSASTSSTST